MVQITLEVNAQDMDIIGIKETLAQYLEKFGDVRIIEVKTKNIYKQGEIKHA